MKVPGGVPEMRPDQALQPLSRAGSGPAPQSQVFFGRLVVISGSGPATGLFVYAGTPGPGNPPIFSITTSATDPFGNAVPPNTVNGTTLPLIIGAITAQAETLNPGPFLLYSNVNLSVFVFSSTGTFTPTSNGTVQVGFIGQGGAAGAPSGVASGGGGGGEYAQDTDTVTSATPYTITLDATSTRATFNTKTVTAHAGTAGTTSSHGAGGSGSTNAVHFSGGAGGSGNINNGGSGGGGAGAGSAGSAGTTAGTGGAGGSAGGVFPAGGKGGSGGAPGVSGGNGTAPGGGGGAGGSGAASSGTGGAGLAVIFFTGTGGSTQLVDSIANNAGTDPNTGTAYKGGTWNYNPTFGTSAGLSAGQLTLNAGVTTTSVKASGGYPVAVSSTDTNVYDMSEFHLVVSPAQSITATVFPNAVTGATVPVGINHYRFRCVINCTTASVAGTPQFEFTFPSATGVMMQTYTPLSTAGNAQSNQNSFAAATSLSLAIGPTLNGHGFICVWEGDITPTAAGNLALNAITSAVADPFTVATVWLDLYPVN